MRRAATSTRMSAQDGSNPRVRTLNLGARGWAWRLWWRLSPPVTQDSRRQLQAALARRDPQEQAEKDIGHRVNAQGAVRERAVKVDRGRKHRRLSEREGNERDEPERGRVGDQGASVDQPGPERAIKFTRGTLTG